ncbi:MAG TPA: carboxypeptidase-like regulatory domain-containing protein, partial [Gemmatimonadales bacterium]|nr:carboxypeptidase-like regulatory domain-containing protein [Gemmatimonadales bacterium]
YFDVDGSRTPTQPDSALPGITVSLIAKGTPDTVASKKTDQNGSYSFPGVPVGTYAIEVDTAGFGDSISVVKQDSSQVTVHPLDTLTVTSAVSYPSYGVAAARALGPGHKVFVPGIVLNPPGLFSDTSVFLADTSAAIRGTDVRPSNAFAGDSVRFFGLTSTRDGQPILTRVQIYDIGVGTLPAPVRLTTAEAAGANGGALDASLVKVFDASITDTTTDVNGNYLLTVDDSTGALNVVFDQNASLTRTPYVPGVKVDVTGLLVPSGTGDWVLRPRANSDVVKK